MEYALAPLFALLNRARGNHLFEQTESTTVSRLLSTLGMALLIYLTALFQGYDIIRATLMCLWALATLMLWCIFAWDRYWEACLGGPVNSQTGFVFVDWLMRFWPLPTEDTALRLWGLLAMTLRQLLILPCLTGLAYLSGHSPVWSLGTLLLGACYYVAGYAVSNGFAVMTAELCSGGLIGFLVSKSIAG